VVGLVALQPASTTRTPVTGPSPSISIPVSPDFKTVAQVVNAAADATPAVDPTAAPYWKVVLRQHVLGCGPEPDRCAMEDSTYTIWNGLGRPGVVQTEGGSAPFAPTSIPPAAGIAVSGRQMTWAEANSRHWTQSELASLVADGVAAGKPGRPRAEWYIFKNTADLLMTSPAGSDLRKQLWRYLATVAGARLDGKQTDALGRGGWRISYTLAGYGEQSFLVDSVTGQLLETRVLIAGAEQKEPSVTTLVSAGPAATAPAPES
jgi:hypothetical protein